MERIFYALAVLFCLAACQNIPDNMLQEGTIAPDFILPGQDGKKVTLNDYRGKWVVLYFYPKDFTHGCSLEAHNFQEDIAEYRAKNAVIIGVSVDSVDSHKGFCAKQGLDFKLLSDTNHSVAGAYGSIMKHGEDVLAARNTFLIDPKGVIRKTYATVDPVDHSHEVLADLEHLQSEEKR